MAEPGGGKPGEGPGKAFGASPPASSDPKPWTAEEMAKARPVPLPNPEPEERPAASSGSPPPAPGQAGTSPGGPPKPD